MWMSPCARQDFLEGLRVIHLVQVIILHDTPGGSLKGAKKVQHCFLGPFREFHFLAIDHDAFPPFTVSSSGAVKGWNEAVPMLVFDLRGHIYCCGSE